MRTLAWLSWMRAARVAVAACAVACGCIVSPVMHFGGPTTEQAQHDRLTELMPIPLATEGTWPGDVRGVKVRVWADDDYRAQNVKWEQGFDETLAYVNAVLAPLLGIRIEPEYRAWDRHAPGETLLEALAELGRLDDGADVFSVIGLTSSLSLVTGTVDNLGYASLPGRYLVVRGYADHAERAAFEQIFRDLEPDEREQLAQARRRHQLAAVLLHEIGHNLGAPHEDGDTIMNPTYSIKWSTFSDHAHALMLATVDARLGRPHRAAPEHPTLLVVVSATGDVAIEGKPFDDEEVDAMLRASFMQDRDTEVVVQPARATPPAVIAKLVDRATAIGLRHVSVAGGP